MEHYNEKLRANPLFCTTDEEPMDVGERLMVYH